MSLCKLCSSFAINHNSHGRDGSDGDLCDVCYWRKRAEAIAAPAPANEWREAVLNELAITCIDYPVVTPPRDILKGIIAMREAMVASNAEPRKPLTEEAILRYIACMKKEEAHYIRFARDIEAHHGIKEK